MPNYRKKPVQIEARLLTYETAPDIAAWLAEYKLSVNYWSPPPMRQVKGLIIPTLEGYHEASFGDYIIKGIAGEFYPCKPEIFHNSYEMIISSEDLADLLSWNTSSDEDGPLGDRISTHDGDWVLDGDIYYFEPNKEN